MFGTWGWFRQPGARGYLLMLAVGFLIGVSVEWFGVHVVKRWSYKDQMPRLPGINLGLVPVLQMLFLPPLIFRTVRFMMEHHSTSPR